MPQQQRVGRDESARLPRTSGRVTRSCCPAWCARSLGRERVASTAVLTAGVDDPGITVIIARRALLARPGQRVRHRLTPTGRRAHRRTVVCMRPTGDARPTCVGARRCLARRASRRGNIRAGNHPGGIAHATVGTRSRRRFRPSRAGGSGVAAWKIRPPWRGEAPRRVPHLGGAENGTGHIGRRGSVRRAAAASSSSRPRSRGPHGVGDRAGRKPPGSFSEPASAGCRTAPLGGESASARCAG
jgi:hypothetical protein